MQNEYLIILKLAIFQYFYQQIIEYECRIYWHTPTPQDVRFLNNYKDQTSCMFLFINHRSIVNMGCVGPPFLVPFPTHKVVEEIDKVQNWQYLYQSYVRRAVENIGTLLLKKGSTF